MPIVRLSPFAQSILVVAKRLSSFLTLLVAISITLSITIYPHLLSINGKPDHMAGMFLFWSMSAGYVHGVGYTPKKRLFRWMFGIMACFLALGLSIARLIGTI